MCEDDKVRIDMDSVLLLIAVWTWIIMYATLLYGMFIGRSIF